MLIRKLGSKLVFHWCNRSFLIIFYGVLNPIVNKKKAQLDDMNLKIEETNKFINDINVSRSK